MSTQQSHYRHSAAAAQEPGAPMAGSGNTSPLLAAGRCSSSMDEPCAAAAAAEHQQQGCAIKQMALSQPLQQQQPMLLSQHTKQPLRLPAKAPPPHQAGPWGAQRCQQHQHHQQQQQRRQPGRSPGMQAVAMLAACAAWVLVSSGAILINKHIMVDLSFHFPAAVAALGMAGTTLASVLACVVLRLVPRRARVTPYFFFTRVMATGFFMALSFQAGNMAYLYLSVAFVQMLKAFTPVSTMLCGFVTGLERPSARLAAAVACISVGVVIASAGEVNFSGVGVAAMLASVAAEGLRTCLMQHLLAAKGFHPMEAWLYLGPACLLWLALIICGSEAAGIREALSAGGAHWQQLLALPAHATGAAAAAAPAVAAVRWFVAAAAVGAAVNTLAMAVIKLGSALTLKVLGISKDIGLVGLGVALLGEHVAPLQGAGYAVSLAGVAFYNWLKARQQQQQQQGCGGGAGASAAAAGSHVKQASKVPLPLHTQQPQHRKEEDMLAVPLLLHADGASLSSSPPSACRRGGSDCSLSGSGSGPLIGTAMMSPPSSPQSEVLVVHVVAGCDGEGRGGA